MCDEISVVLGEQDFIDAYRPAPRPKRLAMLVLLLAAMLVLLLLALLVRYPEARLAFTTSPLIAGLTGAVVLAATLVAGLLLAAPMLRRRAAKSTLNDHPGMRDAICYTFDAQHFSVKATYTQARYPWAELWDWRESERVLIVMPTPRNFYVVPKRGVDLALLDRLRTQLMSARRRVSGRTC